LQIFVLLTSRNNILEHYNGYIGRPT